MSTKPKFSTVIEARRAGGNIFEIVGKARVLMRQLDIPRREIEEFSQRVRRQPSYQDALAVVREWFPVLTDED